MNNHPRQDHNRIPLPQWREGKVRPIQGSPPHDRPVSRGILPSLEEGLRRSLIRHHRDDGSQPYSESHRAFSRHRGIYRSDRQLLLQNLGRGTASRWSGPSQVTTVRDGWSTHRPSSAMSSDRLFLDRVARQHCPSPLHRHAQIIMHFKNASLKPERSTLPGIGTFYFALTYANPPGPLVVHRSSTAFLHDSRRLTSRRRGKIHQRTARRKSH